MRSPPFYYKETQGFRISVIPEYLAAESDPHLERFVYAYTVRIENCSKIIAQLLSREWYIEDSCGESYSVSGDGVVGQQPILMPGDVHEYRSFCVLKSGLGHMSGWYSFVSEDGLSFRTIIPRFELRSHS
jgi:ApaG protein